MKSSPVVAIAGATGVVGQEILTILGDRKFPFSELRLLASQDSVGELYESGGESYEVELLSGQAFAGVDLAFFATAPELAKTLVPQALAAGATVIDVSNQFRMDAEVPLVVPEVNYHAIKAGQRLIANPAGVVTQLVAVLDVIQQAAGLKRVVVSTYQAVSGAGKSGLDELWAQTLAVFSQTDAPQEVFPHEIAFNCLPHVDVFLEDGSTKEEQRIVNETRKILQLPGLPVSATAVRVPVFHSDAESVNVETDRPLEVSELVSLLEKRGGFTVLPHPEDYPVQRDVAGSDEIFVSRIRRDSSVPHGFNMWLVTDNIRKGAALNAVQIAERLCAAA